jgi:hypothetical protein
MSSKPVFLHEPVLDTVERVSEMCFGLFMALTFVGAVNAAGDENQTGVAMFYTAFGCNLAWGLVDAVMYLVRTLTNRGKVLSLARAVRGAPDPQAANRALRNGLPQQLSSLLGDAELDTIRTRIMSMSFPEKPQLAGTDFVGASGIFLIVVASTFPVALPFVLMQDPKAALIVSRVLTLFMLFGGGLALGKFAGYGSWRTGAAMVGLGMVLTVAIIALGG